MVLYPRFGHASATWEDRNPWEWTPQDIQTVLNHSAWVREVSLEINPPVETPARPRPKSSRPNHGVQSEFKALVRWESGLPVRLARKTATLPDKGVGQYMLSISRLPLEFIEQSSGNGTIHHDEGAGLDKTALAERVAKNSSLQRTGKDAIPANHAEWVESDFSPRVVIFFPLGANPIQPEDREVDLVSQIGALVVRAKFSLKEMVYRDRLEL
jgi:hypothetical protein